MTVDDSHYRKYNKLFSMGDSRDGQLQKLP